MVERRDQVLMGFLVLAALSATIFSSRWPSTNGPFLMERPIVYFCFIGRPSRRVTIKRSEGLHFFRVLKPLVITPQGVTGCPPPEVLPAPPPMGWSTGCLLYTSDAADDLLCVDLGGRRIIKKK